MRLAVDIGGTFTDVTVFDERSGEDKMVLESSLYTKASLHPFLTGALFVGAGLATAAPPSPALPAHAPGVGRRHGWLCR